MADSEMTQQEARRIVVDALDTYGRPYWLGYVPRSIRRLAGYTFIEELLNSTEREPVRRSDKYQAIIDWTQEHVYEEVTPQDVMEVGNISYPTALKLIGDRPDIFRKIKRGLYELRNPQEDRKKVS